MRAAIALLGVVILAGCGGSAGTGAQPSLDTLPASAERSAPLVVERSSPGAVLAMSTPAVEPPTTLVGVSDLPVAKPTFESVFADLTAEGAPDVGGPECAAELAHIVVASLEAEAASADGVAVTGDQVTARLTVELLLWEIDENDQLLPAAGSPCPDIGEQRRRAEATRACEVDRRTVEVAIEAYVAVHGREPASQQDLVDTDLLRELAADFEIADTGVRATPGSECETLLNEERERQAQADAEPLTDEDACRVARRTLETAVEAHFAQFGIVPASVAALVESGMIAAEHPDFELGPNGTVLVVDGSRCQ